MKHVFQTLAALTFCLVSSLPIQAAEATPRFAVVRIINYDKSLTNQVMSAANLETLKTNLQTEAALFGKALLATANEWKQDELLRKKVFPTTAFGPRQATVVGPFYDSEQKAIAALTAMLAAKAKLEPKRKHPTAASEKDQLAAQAQELLLEHLDELANPPPAEGAASTSKITLTAGQTLTRTTTGATQTSYHIAVPDKFNPDKLPPLLVVFSPGGNGRGLMNQVRPSANKVDWMVIGCDKLKNGMKEEEERAIEKDFMKDLQTFIPYDRTRLYYGGFSGGGARAYSMTHHFKDKCAGILAFGGWLGGADEQKRPFQRNMAVAMVNGDKDPGAASWEAADKAVLERRRCKVKIFHFPGAHSVAPGAVIDEAIAWLNEQAAPTNIKATTPEKKK